MLPLRGVLLQEWYELGCRLSDLNAVRFVAMVRALRCIVEAQEQIAKLGPPWNGGSKN